MYKGLTCLTCTIQYTVLYVTCTLPLEMFESPKSEQSSHKCWSEVMPGSTRQQSFTNYLPCKDEIPAIFRLCKFKRSCTIVHVHGPWPNFVKNR